ncbi:hypothetical protein [Methylobacterium sp. WL7]|uniref:hypothetical protein n=1 Tax=Methylobacterium sp. WL7 TaxID=2603900 RepID=UPI0011CA0787|nr:hypothetical protein [Methylobacterium sp. WL7]TXN43413.1 hypothetical protein FV233_18640 [Methylobacterium sp. WL7]
MLDARKDPFLHYQSIGAGLGIWPNPLFDPTWYISAYPEERGDGLQPVMSYLQRGLLLDRRPNQYFDTRWYVERYPEVKFSKLHPLIHYLRFGVHLGLDPSEQFCTTWYLENNPDVCEASEHPLVHFLHHGNREGRSATLLDQQGRLIARVAKSSSSPATTSRGLLEADKRDPVLHAFREAVGAVLQLDPAARFQDATYPNHILPNLLPGTPVIAQSTLASCENKLQFYANFRQEGGHKPILVGRLPPATGSSEWVYIGSIEELPYPLAAALETRSFLVLQQASQGLKAAESTDGELVSRVPLSQDESTGLKILALIATKRLHTLRRTGVDKTCAANASLPSGAELQPRHFICANGFSEEGGGHSWFWCGPEQVRHIALGRRPAENIALKISFEAIDLISAERIQTLVGFSINGRRLEAVFKVSETRGEAVVLIPFDNAAVEPLVLSVGCREGKSVTDDPRLLTIHITAIVFMYLDGGDIPETVVTQ